MSYLRYTVDAQSQSHNKQRVFLRSQTAVRDTLDIEMPKVKPAPGIAAHHASIFSI